MKKGKLIGISVALSGCVVSIGTALALYQGGFGVKKYFGFGGFTYHASNGAYSFLSSLDNNGATGFDVEAGTAALNPTNNSVRYAFKIAAAYGSESAGLVKQDAILGKLSITKTGDLKNNISVAAYVDGYSDNDKNTGYWHGGDSLNVRTLGGEGDTISAYIPAPTSTSASMAAAITAGKYLTVHVTITLNTITDADFVALDQGQYSLSVSYADVDDGYGRPYIVGGGTGWTVEEEYAMVPNLAASAYEFCFKGLNSDSAHTFESFQVLKNIGAKDKADIWNGEKWMQFGLKGSENNKGDIVINTATEYFVTFKGDSHGGFTVDGNNIYQD